MKIKKDINIFNKLDLSEVILEDNKNNMNKWYNSSSNPEELSLTIRGILLAWVPMIITIGQFFRIDITQELLIELIQTATATISALMILWGVLRKIYNKFK